jgi:hypothetical protein
LPTNHELARFADTSYVNPEIIAEFECDPFSYTANGAGHEATRRG